MYFRKNYDPAVIVDKRALQKQVDQEVELFLSNGGIISKIPTGLCVGHSRISRDSRQVNVVHTIASGDTDG